MWGNEGKQGITEDSWVSTWGTVENVAMYWVEKIKKEEETAIYTAFYKCVIDL